MTFRRLTASIKRLRSDRRGNVLMIFGFALLPMTFAVGMTIDYARAAKLQTKINTIADAAVLAAVTQPMMSQSTANAATRVKYMFYNQADATQGFTRNGTSGTYTVSIPYNYDGFDGTLAIKIVDNIATGLTRTATVSYSSQSSNVFSGVLGMQTIGIAGTSTAKAQTAPNIDFYLLLDTSGSMALPSTSAGLTLLRSKTGGCAFACHSSNDAQAKDANGNMTDYYGVARSFNIPLRVDEAKTAISGMMTQATTTMSQNNAVYRAALNTFAASDTRANNSFQTLSAITGNLPSVGTAASNAQTSFYYKNSCPTSAFCNNDQDSAMSDAFTKMNNTIPVPGNGSKNVGDTPQNILFLISDGMRDEFRPNGQPEAAVDVNWCNTIKAKGTRIAVLYTEYLAGSLTGDAWSQTNVAPNLYKVEPALQACASDGLYYKVTTDDDISAALNQLFQKVVATAHLTN